MFMTLVYGCKIWNKKINNLAYEVFMSILENKALFYGLLSTPNVKKRTPLLTCTIFQNDTKFNFIPWQKNNHTHTSGGVTKLIPFLSVLSLKRFKFQERFYSK